MKASPSRIPASPCGSPICQPVPLHDNPNFPPYEITFSFLPQQEMRELMAAFRTAPQFAAIQPEDLLQRQSEGLRVVLIGSEPYYNRQAACYLSAMAKLQREVQNPAPDSDAELDLNLYELFSHLEETDPSPQPDSHRVLFSVPASALDPDLAPASNGSKPMVPGETPRPFPLSSLGASTLITAPSGPVLSEAVIRQIRIALSAPKSSPVDFFVSLTPQQVDWEWIQELQFVSQFQIAWVGQSNMDYLCRLLAHTAQEKLVPVAKDADLKAAIIHLRHCRGSRFEETDLLHLVDYAILRGAQAPLCTADLMFQSCRPQLTSSRLQLSQMIGLTPIKETLCRFLASAKLDRRLQQSGIYTQPMCRNLAFSGPPGTGKSVTARLIAQIMREEGCGTGRFVEAGREDLVGTYLGHTSPKIAKLFQRAKGGVLFIDEAGALFDEGDTSDSYATEAVNALVRHMELEPETTVIFATYPEEMKRLLASNPGLSSRIAHTLDFSAYDDQQLWEILCHIAKSNQMSIPVRAKAPTIAFFHTLRLRKGDRFGNGREARRLFQSSMEELALRVENIPDANLMLSTVDLKKAAHRLLEQEPTETRRVIGF